MKIKNLGWNRCLCSLSAKNIWFWAKHRWICCLSAASRRFLQSLPELRAAFGDGTSGALYGLSNGNLVGQLADPRWPDCRRHQISLTSPREKDVRTGSSFPQHSPSIGKTRTLGQWATPMVNSMRPLDIHMFPRVLMVSNGLLHSVGPICPLIAVGFANFQRAEMVQFHAQLRTTLVGRCNTLGTWSSWHSRLSPFIITTTKPAEYGSCQNTQFITWQRHFLLLGLHTTHHHHHLHHHLRLHQTWQNQAEKNQLLWA